MDETVAPVRRLRGSLAPPGDKSVAHRGLILAAMADGECRIRNCAPGADVASTAACLRALGVAVTGENAGQNVMGRGWEVAKEAHLDAGNSGTTMRLLAGALAGRPGRFEIRGDASLSRRPMDRIAEPLRRMGASVDLAGGRYPPVRLSGAALTGISYRLPVASAQVKGAVLLAGLQAAGDTVVLEAIASRDHTERLLRWLGVPVDVRGDAIRLAGGEGRLPLAPFSLDVPGDFSSAAFLLTAACLLPGSEVDVRGVGLNPTRTGLLDVLAAMGARIEVGSAAGDPEPAGALRASGGPLHGTEVGGPLVVRTIDELPLVALAATQAEGETIIRNAAELRLKESDRLAVVAEGLRALGASVEEARDGLAVQGPTPLSGGRVDPRGDHRLALTFAVAGMVAREPVVVQGWECTRVSYPDFAGHVGALAS